jgi:hypothetical protein
VAPVWRFDRHIVEAGVREQVTRWRSMLTSHVADARQLRETLSGPIRFNLAKDVQWSTFAWLANRSSRVRWQA